MFSFFLVNSLYGLYCWLSRPACPENIYDVGVVVGKFYPPHKGHEFLIRTAVTQCKQVVVIVCVKPDECPGQERAEWLKENVPGPDYHVFQQTDTMDDNDTEFWAQTTLNILQPLTPDACFTSEWYGEAFAKALGGGSNKKVVGVRVDQARKRFPVSGSRVRQDPWSCWQYLSENVRAYYSHVVVLVGAESTGKSTLAVNMKNSFSELSPLLVEEHGRTVSERKRDPRKGWDEQDFVEIATVQTSKTNEAMRKSFLVICDTDARATAVWQRHLMRNGTPAIEELAQEAPIPDLFIVCPVIGSTFVQDGTRKNGDHRLEMEEELLERCLDTGARVVKLTETTWDGRTQEALEAVQELLQKKQESGETLELSMESFATVD